MSWFPRIARCIGRLGNKTKRGSFALNITWINSLWSCCKILRGVLCKYQENFKVSELAKTDYKGKGNSLQTTSYLIDECWIWIGFTFTRMLQNLKYFPRKNIWQFLHEFVNSLTWIYLRFPWILHLWDRINWFHTRGNVLWQRGFKLRKCIQQNPPPKIKNIALILYLQLTIVRSRAGPCI